jgi:hypothetical protein
MRTLTGRRLLVGLWAVLQFGCEGGQSGTEGSRCGNEPGSRCGSGDGDGDAGDPCHGAEPRALESDEATAIGSPTEIAAAYGGETQTTLRWYDRSEGETEARDTELTLRPTLDSDDARLVPITPYGSTECIDSVELAASLTLRTADGTFDSVVEGFVIVVAIEGQALFRADVATDGLGGSYDVSPLVEENGSIRLSLNTTFGSVGKRAQPSGSIDFVGEPRSLDGHSASVGGGTVAEWPAPQ